MVEVWRKNPNFHLSTYEPKKKFEIEKEAVPFLARTGSIFERCGGVLRILTYSVFIGIFGFFKAEEKIKEFKMKREKVLDLRCSRRKGI